MTYRYNDILKIPERNLNQQKLTKAFFLRNFILSSEEKKLLNNSIQQMEIIAQLIPDRSNIPAVVNETHSFEQILIIVCTVLDNKLEILADKCIQLIQKHISHQVFLIVEDSHEFVLNASEKRINQNDRTKLTVERYFTSKSLSKLYQSEISKSFFRELDFGKLDKTNLEFLYKNYIRAIVQYQVASKTGSFFNRTNQRTEEDMVHLDSIARLEREIKLLTNQLRKEIQLNEKIQLNIQIHKKREEIKFLNDTLTKI